MTDTAADMAMRFLRQHLHYWRAAKGLPKARASHRADVRYWIAAYRRVSK